MHFDFILNGIIDKAIRDVKLTTGIDITIEQAKEMIMAQSKGIRYGMENRLVAKVDYLGKFGIKKGKEEAIEASRQAKKLGLKGEDRRKFFRDFKRANEFKVLSRIM